MLDLTREVNKWSLPKQTLNKVIKRLQGYYGKEIIIWGGGGAGGSTAILNKATIEPTILRNEKGYSLRASLTRVNPPISPYEEDKTEWTPWIGSWQLSVNV